MATSLFKNSSFLCVSEFLPENSTYGYVCASVWKEISLQQTCMQLSRQSFEVCYFKIAYFIFLQYTEVNLMISQLQVKTRTVFLEM